MIISNGYAIEFAFGLSILELRSCLLTHRFIWPDENTCNFSTKKFAKKLI